MKKLIASAILSLAGLSLQVQAETRVLVCNDCSVDATAESYALERAYVPQTVPFDPNLPPGEISVGNMVTENIAVVNLNSRQVFTYRVTVTTGVGYQNKTAYQLGNDADLIEAVDAYLALEQELSSFGQMKYSPIPAHLAIKADYPAGASISEEVICTVEKGTAYQVPTYISTNVSGISNDLNKQEAIAEMLRGTVMAGSMGYVTGAVKFYVSRILRKRPLTITTRFDDGSTIEWGLFLLQGSIPFRVLPETAKDADCKKIDFNDELGVFSQTGGGGYKSTEYDISGPLPGLTTQQECITTWTSSGGKYVPQLTCWFNYIG